MKIAIVSPYISTLDSTEYYQSQQLNLAIELSKLGVASDIITAKRVPEEADEYNVNEKVTVYRLPVIARWTNGFFNQLIMVGLWKQLQKEKYDFIQSSEDCVFSTFMSALYVLLVRSRLIIYQGIYEYSSRKMVRTLMRFYDITAGIVLKRACCMAVCKTQRANQFLQKKGFKRTHVIPVGVNTELFYPEDRPDNKSLELLAVGNLIPLKNYQLMIDVLSSLIKIEPNARLTVIGSGPEKGRILSLVQERKILDHFRLLENIPNREMRLYYSQADLLLLLSKTEIFGMVILEAMACGCPVIATPTPGVVDVITDCVSGFVIKDFKPANIAGRLIKINADRPLLQKIRGNALRMVHDQYSWQAIASQYYELYSSLKREQ